jgi:hypothetical protein
MKSFLRKDSFDGENDEEDEYLPDSIWFIFYKQLNI